MITTLFGFKRGQTRQFTEDGSIVPVTSIEVTPAIVSRVFDGEANRGYQLAVGTQKKLDKPTTGQLKKAGIEKQPRFFREVRVTDLDETITLASEIKPGDVFSVGDEVAVSGISRGKGFSGVVKRHGFSGGPKTHGQGDHWRSPGSIGAGTTPGRVYKGKRMAGKAGNERVTVQGLSILAVDSEKNIITVKGLIPGRINGLVQISKQ